PEILHVVRYSGQKWGTFGRFGTRRRPPVPVDEWTCLTASLDAPGGSRPSLAWPVCLGVVLLNSPHPVHSHSATSSPIFAAMARQSQPSASARAKYHRALPSSFSISCPIAYMQPRLAAARPCPFSTARAYHSTDRTLACGSPLPVAYM